VDRTPREGTPVVAAVAAVAAAAAAAEAAVTADHAPPEGSPPWIVEILWRAVSARKDTRTGTPAARYARLNLPRAYARDSRETRERKSLRCAQSDTTIVPIQFADRGVCRRLRALHVLRPPMIRPPTIPGQEYRCC